MDGQGFPSSIQKIIDRTLAKSHVHGLALSLRHKDEQWSGSFGDLAVERPWFIASTTKLFTSSCILRLISEQKLELHSKLSELLPESDYHGIHRLKGKDSSADITIKELLSHTSGLPDYFQFKLDSVQALQEAISQGNDLDWDFQQAMEWTRSMPAEFAPSQLGKALYSDTNYQLLGRILEVTTGMKLSALYDRWIIQPLGLEHTYLYSDPSDTRPSAIHFKDRALQIPQAMASFQADGGVVSNAEELMHFLRAFMGGQLFPKEMLPSLHVWNPIFFPLQAGIGLLRFKAPWYFSPFKRIPEMIGHSGLSGAFAFHLPSEDIYMAGTVNQIHKPGTSFQLMCQLVLAMMKES